MVSAKELIGGLKRTWRPLTDLKCLRTSDICKHRRKAWNEIFYIKLRVEVSSSPTKPLVSKERTEGYLHRELRKTKSRERQVTYPLEIKWSRLSKGKWRNSCESRKVLKKSCKNAMKKSRQIATKKSRQT